MPPKTIEIEHRQVRILPANEGDRDVLLWLDEALPHVGRYLGRPMHREVEDWLRDHAKSMWYAGINHLDDGMVRLADADDAERFVEAFGDRLW